MASPATPMAAVTVLITTSGQGPSNNRPRPRGSSVNANGTRNAGSEYFHVSIIVWNGRPPVSAAAANGASAVGGLTSDRTA